MTKAPQFPMKLVIELQRQAISEQRPIYLLHLASWTATDKQPSRFRSHWMIDRQGKLWKWAKPESCTDDVQIKYLPVN
jgi:hypothetical protein